MQNNGGDGVDFSGCCNFTTQSTVVFNHGDGVHLTGSDNLVTNTNASSNSGNGIVLAGGDNQITKSVAGANQGNGASVECPGAITGLTTKNNNGTPLATSGGTCTQVNNKLN